jgi:hypothetical protein
VAQRQSSAGSFDMSRSSCRALDRVRRRRPDLSRHRLDQTQKWPVAS